MRDSGSKTIAESPPPAPISKRSDDEVGYGKIYMNEWGNIISYGVELDNQKLAAQPRQLQQPASEKKKLQPGEQKNVLVETFGGGSLS